MSSGCRRAAWPFPPCFLHNSSSSSLADQRLPLPGEQPITAWKPRYRQARHLRFLRYTGSRWRLLIWLVAVFTLVTGYLIWRATAVPVTVVINGEPLSFRTHRRSVGGAIQAAGVRVGTSIFLNPPTETPLEPGMVITVAHLRPVIVHADAQTLIANTHSLDPQAILNELDLSPEVGAAWRIERAVRPATGEIVANPALADVPIFPREITVVHPQTVIVNEVVTATDSRTHVSFQTTARTLGEALTQAGFVLYEADRVSLPLGTPLTEQTEIMIERSIPVTVQADGRLYIVRTHQPRVGALLAELGLALIGSDYVLPGPDQALQPSEWVRVVRVSQETRIQDMPIPYGISYVPDPDLELDQQRVIQDGQPGVLRRQIRVRYEDGAEVSQVVQAEWIHRPPQAQVIGYGTRIIFRSLDTPSGPVRYWRVLHMLATSYSPSTAGHKQPGDPFFGLSATGATVLRGVVAVDPRVIGLGTHLYVPGYGFGRALDVGGAVKGMRIDLGYDDENLVLWNNWVDVYLLPPVPPPDQMIWMLPG